MGRAALRSLMLGSVSSFVKSGWCWQPCRIVLRLTPDNYAGWWSFQQRTWLLVPNKGYLPPGPVRLRWADVGALGQWPFGEEETWLGLTLALAMRPYLLLGYLLWDRPESSLTPWAMTPPGDLSDPVVGFLTRRLSNWARSPSKSLLGLHRGGLPLLSGLAPPCELPCPHPSFGATQCPEQQCLIWS